MFNRNKKVFEQFDWILFLCTLAICIFGLFIVHSALAPKGIGWEGMKTQVIATGIGFFLIFFLQFVDTAYLKKLAKPAYFLSLLLLVLVLFFGYGKEYWGANSWLKLGSFQFQPSEFAKVGIIFFLSYFLEKYRGTLNKVQTVFFLALLMGIPLMMIMLQPDLGTTAVFLFFIAIMVFQAEISWKYILAALIIALLAAPLIYINLSEKQQYRILNFLNPNLDPRGYAYQGLQGTIAIGSGRMTGKGYMQGTQTQFGFIPAQDTDFIFSVLTEQFGFLGGTALILTYGLILYRGLSISKNANTYFERSLVLGICAMLFIHIFENIGMTLGLMPMTGIPLPLISNGGTFQIINLFCIGLILSVGSQRRPLDFNQSTR